MNKFSEYILDVIFFSIHHLGDQGEEERNFLCPKHYEVVSSSVRPQKSSDNLGKRGSWWPSSSIWLSKELSIVIKEARLTFSTWVPSTHLSICWTLTMGQVLGYEAEGPHVPLGRTARSTGCSLPSQVLSRGTPTNTPTTTTHPGYRVSTQNRKTEARKQADILPTPAPHHQRCLLSERQSERFKSPNFYGHLHLSFGFFPWIKLRVSALRCT